LRRQPGGCAGDGLRSEEKASKGGSEDGGADDLGCEVGVDNRTFYITTWCEKAG
jgi:hypothetical protein